MRSNPALIPMILLAKQKSTTVACVAKCLALFRPWIDICWFTQVKGLLVAKNADKHLRRMVTCTVIKELMVAETLERVMSVLEAVKPVNQKQQPEDLEPVAQDANANLVLMLLACQAPAMDSQMSSLVVMPNAHYAQKVSSLNFLWNLMFTLFIKDKAFNVMNALTPSLATLISSSTRTCTTHPPTSLLEAHSNLLPCLPWVNSPLHPSKTK